MTESSSSGKSANGHAVNGSAKLNGSASLRRQATKPRRGFLASVISLLARLATWGALLTLLFRCPPSLEACDETSPYICKPYFQIKNAVSPHVQPYFDHYAAPYLEAGRPYYDAVNTKVISPARDYAVLYGTPAVSKGQEFAKSQWESHGQPQLSRAKALSLAQYEQSVAPHVAKMGEAVGPYYDIARGHSTHAYERYLVPGFEVARPYATRGYTTVADFTTTTALPATYWAWSRVNGFLDTAVWPQLRVVYVENVEPQLVRIGERLGRQRTTKARTKTDESTTKSHLTEATHSTVIKPTPQAPSSSATPPAPVTEEETSAKSMDEPTETAYWNPVQAPAAGDNESDGRRKAREMVASDLAMWQNKFAAQADEGATAMEDTVDEIARDMMNKGANKNGRGLIAELKAAIEKGTADAKEKITTTVEAAEPGSEKESVEFCVAAIRSAGVTIKKKAQVIRGWRQDYDTELQETVLDAADVHFAILDETRNLALQNIGMKWAWTDGVTYKDWQKYHELKGALSDWADELKQLIISHPTLLEAQDASAQIEDEGMAMASAAAQELGRLKEVAGWKITARDATYNFNSDDMREAAELVLNPPKADEAESDDAEKEASQGTSVEESEESAESEDVETEPTTETIELPVTETIHLGYAKSNTESTSSIASSDTDPSVIVVDTDGHAEAEDVQVTPSAEAEDVETDNDEEEIPPSSETLAPPPRAAAFGAAAQSVPDRQPILDDAFDAADSAYSSAVSLAADRYSSALSVVSAQIHGTPKPVHEQLMSSVSSVYDGAVSAAGNKLSQATAAAESATETVKRDWSQVEAIAAQRLNEGRLWAEVQYQSVLLALGATPTPTSVPEKLYDQAKYNYYAGLGMAEDRYSSFMSAASSAWSAATATPTPTDFAGTASSIASVASESAASAASVVDENAKSAYSAASKGAASVVNDVDDTLNSVVDAAGEQIYNAATLAAGSWEGVVSALSAQVYGQPTTTVGWLAATEAAKSDASSRYDAVNSFVSELVSGKDVPFSESAFSRLSAIYATATVGASEASAAAASVGSKVASAASEATEAVKETVQSIRDEL